MPWGAAVGALVGSVANYALSDSSGGGGSGAGGGTTGGSAPPVYIPKDQQGVDANFLSNKGQYEGTLQGQYSATNPFNQQLLQGQMNNPYSGVAQQSALYAQDQNYANSGMAQTQAMQQWLNANQQNQFGNQQNDRFNQNFSKVQNATNTLYGMGDKSNTQYQGLMDYQKGQLGSIQQSQNNLYNAGNQVLQNSQDPQNALYNRTQQLLTDQSRAGQYARGIQSSPYGAALENSANENFNIDWQNQQLARQSQGLQSAQNAYGSAQGLGNSYTGTQAGLQSGQNDQYANLTNAASSQYANYLGAQNQSNANNAQTLAGIQQNAANLGNYSAQQVTQGGQAQNAAYQSMYGQQNQALQNYQGNNQGYLQGLNQLQSNDLGYMNFGQSAQNLGYNQNLQNNQLTQQAISSITGPVSNALSNTNWGNVGNTVSGWFGGGSGGTVENVLY